MFHTWLSKQILIMHLQYYVSRHIRAGYLIIHSQICMKENYPRVQDLLPEDPTLAHHARKVSRYLTGGGGGSLFFPYFFVVQETIFLAVTTFRFVPIMTF